MIYDLPRPTLLNKLSGHVTAGRVRLGRKMSLTPAQETTLVNYANLMSKVGSPLIKPEDF